MQNVTLRKLVQLLLFLPSKRGEGPKGHSPPEKREKSEEDKEKTKKTKLLDNFNYRD